MARHDIPRNRARLGAELCHVHFLTKRITPILISLRRLLPPDHNLALPRYFRPLWVGLALLAVSSGPVQAVDKADLVKAAIIEKVARFIEWPGQAGSPAAFQICTAADHPLLPAIRVYYENIVLAERPVVIQVLRKGDPLNGCRIFYAKDTADLARLRASAEAGHVLLIAEGSDMAKAGMHVGFYTDMNRLRIEVNRKSLEAAGLKASFRLLEVAKVVEP